MRGFFLQFRVQIPAYLLALGQINLSKSCFSFYLPCRIVVRTGNYTCKVPIVFYLLAQPIEAIIKWAEQFLQGRGGIRASERNGCGG